MSRFYWDSMIFIYWIEGHPVFLERIERILERIRERGDTLCTSHFTVGEILVGPIKCKDAALEQHIHEVFASPEIQLIPFRSQTALHYARARAGLNVRAADAIHLASAAEVGTDVFLTNDTHLIGKVVPGIQFITGLDTNLF